MAGYMLECVMESTYEELLVKYLFEPLGITNAGFGMPKNMYGHGAQNNFEPNQVDNPIAITPAGRMHLPIEEWGRFIAVTLSFKLCNELLGITESTYNTLYQFPTNTNNVNYCYGAWLPCRREWAYNGKAFTHDGSNMSNYSSAWLAPLGLANRETLIHDSSFAAIVCTNHGLGEAASSIIWDSICNVNKIAHSLGIEFDQLKQGERTTEKEEPGAPKITGGCILQ
jgi:hypothetical protein